MATCIACTTKATAQVVDGAFTKPVCETHAELYGDDGYTILRD